MKRTSSMKLKPKAPTRPVGTANRVDVVRNNSLFYKDVKFDSRLEVAWAVFFDIGMIEWQYKPFVDGPFAFYLPEPIDAHVAVISSSDEHASEKVLSLGDHLVWGGDVKTILILSDIPQMPYDGGLLHYPCLYHAGVRGVTSGWFYFYATGENLVKLSGKVSFASYKPPHIGKWDLDRDRFSIQAESDCSTSLLYEERVGEGVSDLASYNKFANARVYSALDVARFVSGETLGTSEEIPDINQAHILEFEGFARDVAMVYSGTLSHLPYEVVLVEGVLAWETADQIYMCPMDSAAADNVELAQRMIAFVVDMCVSKSSLSDDVDCILVSDSERLPQMSSEKTSSVILVSVEDVDEALTHRHNSTVRSLLASHHRRGFFRNQACGPKFSERKRIWVGPTVVKARGAGDADVVIRRHIVRYPNSVVAKRGQEST